MKTIIWASKKITDWYIWLFWTILALANLLFQFIIYLTLGHPLDGNGFVYFWFIWTLICIIGLWGSTRIEILPDDEYLGIHLVED